MKYIIQLHQPSIIKLGITNLNQAFIFDFLTTAATWADTVVLDGEVYYWVSRTVIVEQLQILNLKVDTVYRHFSALANAGLIKYKKSKEGRKSKDLIQITQKGKAYLFDNQDVDESKDIGKNAKGKNNGKKGKLCFFESKSIKLPTVGTDEVYKNLNIKMHIQKNIRAFGVDIKFLKWFISYRKTLGKPLKTIYPVIAFAKDLQEIKKAGYNIEEAIKLMKNSEWASLKLRYLRSLKLRYLRNSKLSKQSGLDLKGKTYNTDNF